MSYQIAKFRSTYTVVIAILGLTTKFNSCQYFWLYGSWNIGGNYIQWLILVFWMGFPYIYRILPKISPLPLFDFQVLVQVFYLAYKPPPLCYKNALSAKTNVRRSTRTAVSFVVWTVCPPHLSALSVTYHGQSIEISSKNLLMAAMALAIGLGYDHGLVGCMMAALDFSFGSSKREQTA